MAWQESVPSASVLPLTRIEAFYLHAGTRRIFKNVQFLNPDPSNPDPVVFQAHGRDLLGKSLHKIDMAFTDKVPDAVSDVFVAHNFGQLIVLRPCPFPNSKVEVNPNTLGLLLLVLMHTDETRQH